MAFQLSPETGTSTLTQTLEGTWCSLLENFRVESRDKWRLVPPLDRQSFICVWLKVLLAPLCYLCKHFCDPYVTPLEVPRKNCISGFVFLGGWSCLVAKALVVSTWSILWLEPCPVVMVSGLSPLAYCQHCPGLGGKEGRFCSHGNVLLLVGERNVTSSDEARHWGNVMAFAPWTLRYIMAHNGILWQICCW